MASDVGKETVHVHDKSKDQQPGEFRMKILWTKLFFLSFLHIVALYSLTILHHCEWKTLVFGLIVFVVSGLGVTAGAHRLWAHRSYQAKLPLRIFLAVMNCVAWEVPLLQWCRDHRTHHKCSETDGDPHNAKRGFFFSHVGCHLVKKHPEVIVQGRKISIEDLYNDPVVMIQKRIFIPAALFMCIVLPTAIPCLFWGESLWYSYCVNLFRYCISLNSAFSVNSFAHLYGNKPYDVRMNPAENMFVAFFAMGEGFHNYHHVFPQDYSTSEFGIKLNPTTLFIDLMASIGQAYNRKKIPEKLIAARRRRTGNLSGEEDEHKQPEF